jgi:hypothetical protein
MGSPRSSVQTPWGVWTWAISLTLLNISRREARGTFVAIEVESSTEWPGPHHQ